MSQHYHHDSLSPASSYSMAELTAYRGFAERLTIDHLETIAEKIGPHLGGLDLLGGALDPSTEYTVGPQLQLWQVDYPSLNEFDLAPLESTTWQRGRWHIQILGDGKPTGHARVIVGTDPDEVYLCEVSTGDLSCHIQRALDLHEQLCGAPSKEPARLIEDPLHALSIVQIPGVEPQLIVLGETPRTVTPEELGRLIRAEPTRGISVE